MLEAALNGSWERRSSADPEYPEIRVNPVKFYVCATALYHASVEYRDFDLPPP